MNAILAIDGLSATHPRQRARCAVTGRFIAWARVPSLRLATSKGVVGAPAPAPAPVVRAPIVSAPVVSIPAPVVRVVRVSVVSAVRSVLFRVVRSGRSVVARVRSLFGRAGRAGIGGNMDP